MSTKLTLRLDESLIHTAKDYAKKEGKSLSRIVSEFFKAISCKTDNLKTNNLKPHTSKLYGSLKNHAISKDDYNQYIESKYL